MNTLNCSCGEKAVIRDGIKGYCQSCNNIKIESSLWGKILRDHKEDLLLEMLLDDDMKYEIDNEL